MLRSTQWALSGPHWLRGPPSLLTLSILCPPAPSAVVAPQDLQLLKSTEESLQVGWTPAGEADHYLLSYHPLGAELSAEQVRVPGQQHSYEILGLLPGTKYLVTLRSVKKEVSSSPRHLLATTGEAAAGVPGSPGETQF